MASNPPFQAEDQTDEDFFDRLVNDDDFGSNVMSPESDSDEAQDFADLTVGNSDGEGVTGPPGKHNTVACDVGLLSAKTDESKNLGVQLQESKNLVAQPKESENVSVQPEDSKILVAQPEESKNLVAQPEESKNVSSQPEESKNVSSQPEESNNMVFSNSFGFDNVIDSSENGIGSKIASNLLASKSIVSGGLGIKEVGWNAFHPDSEQKGTNGFGSYSDFFSTFEDSSGDPWDVKEDLAGENKNVCGNEEHKVNGWRNVQYQEGQGDEASCTEGLDLNSSQYWENLYPGWRYDANTGQWYQIDGYDTILNTQASLDANSTSDWAAVADGRQEVTYLQQTTHSVVGTFSESGTTETVSNWNQVSQANNGYPEHMVFDPQYPGWYYDTVAQEWRSLESYTPPVESKIQTNDLQNHSGFTTADTSSINSGNRYGEYRQTDNYVSQDLGGQAQYGGYGETNNYGSQSLGGQAPYGEYGQTNIYGQNLEGQDKIDGWAHSYGDTNQQSLKMWQPETITTSKAASEFVATQKPDRYYGSADNVNHQEHAIGAVASKGHQEANGHVGQTSFVPDGTFGQKFNKGNMQQHEQMHLSKDHYGSRKPVNDYYSNQKKVNDYQGSQNQLNDYYGSQNQLDDSYGNKKKVSAYYSSQKPDIPQQSHHSGDQFSYPPNVGVSSAGRPPHALVTFGFGGKLIVMRENSSLVNSSHGSQDLTGGSLSVHNLMEVVIQKTDASTPGCASDYFRALCQQSFSSPLVGGNVGGKELNKWIEERITTCESLGIDYRKCEILKLLFSLLKIAYQHYGKLRSPFSSDTALRETDLPETAIAKLFANAKKNGSQFNEYGALSHCLKNLPSEGQIRATASEVQNLLVSGSKIEALQCAQKGQLWGPALVLASQLGDQFYIDTVKQMALQQMVAGSPMRTLCLLIAGQPKDVFSTDTSNSSFLGSMSVPQQSAQFGTNSMLDDWEENLAVITANRTIGDELVIVHLGDCLWKERSEIFGAHICYLVAEENFESYSYRARLCLIGADHWKSPRTYASPDAIQRTEFFEYSKVLGNSQFILLPFQPYKIIYAHMLAEVGKVSESLKYCQAVLKSLKTSRAPEVETWKQVVVLLEERIKTHQQGGYTANLAPAKLVGKLLNFFDSTAHRVVGGLPPGPSTSQGSIHGGEQYHQSMAPRVSSQSTTVMSSLVPSASMEPISDWPADGNRKTMQNRSVSEPDFGRSQDQVNSSKEATSSNEQSKASGTSRFARFGFGSQILQKTVGLVLKTRSDKQAKLGDSNKFFYDEKLKRWVEEGAESPAEEAALLPPPTNASFHNGMTEYSVNNALKTEGSPPNGSPKFRSPASEHSSGIPPIPPSSNQFSARARTGVRSRYVDTFNQGVGTATNMFQSPPVPSVKPAVAVNAKFFIPAPLPAGEQIMEAVEESKQEDTATTEPSTSIVNAPFQSTAPPSSMTMNRFSLDNIQNSGGMPNRNGSLSSHSRRTSSWSGSLNESFSPPKPTETKPLGQMLGTPGSFTPCNPSMMHMPTRSFGDDLQEVEL